MGDAKAPLIIGKKGEIFDNVDDEFLELFLLHRFKRQNMFTIDIKTAPWRLSYGALLLGELHG